MVGDEILTSAAASLHRRRLAPSVDAIRTSLLSTLTGVPSSALLVVYTSAIEVTVTILMASVSSTTVTASSLVTTVSGDAFLGTLGTSLGETVGLSVAPTITVSLVYPPSPPPPTPAAPGAVVVPPDSTVSGPTLTVGRTSSSQVVTFAGTNMQDGDDAAWVPLGTTSCTSELAFAASQGRTGSVQSGRVTFNLGSGVGPSLWALCYRHRYQQQIISDSFVVEWVLYPSVQLAVVRVDSASPTLAPAVSACSDHTVTIIGAGFSRLPDGADGTFCNFAGAGSVQASISNDTIIECITPVPAASVGSQLRLVYGSAYGDSSTHAAVLSSFTFYDPSAFLINSTSPIGSAYNLATTVWLTGSFPVSGAVNCQLAVNITVAGVLINATHARCPKPIFPNSYKGPRINVLDLAPVNLCWVNASTKFYTYSAQLSTLSISGAPSGAGVTLTITGAGFPYPLAAGSTCRFVNTSQTVKTSATVTSATQITCPTPSTATVGSYEVYISLNDQEVEPSLYGTPSFDTYDLSLVTLSGLTPSAVPVATSTTLTLQGSGFAEYGSTTDSSLSQIRCRVGTQLITARLLDSSNVQCTLPAIAAAGALQVDVSLNGGDPGTFSAQQ